MPDSPGDLAADQLLQLVRQLLCELRGDAAPGDLSLTSRFEEELGLDSLARAELLSRVGAAFRVELPEGLLLSAETPGDLLTALGIAGEGQQGEGEAPPGAEFSQEGDALPDAQVSVPEGAETLQEVLQYHASRHPHRIHLWLHDAHGVEHPLSYAELFRGASRFASGLAAQGLLSGEKVALMLPTGFDYLFSFLGVLLAGGVPVPIYPPLRPSQLEEHLHRHVAILENAEARLLITTREALLPARLLLASVPAVRKVVEPQALNREPGGPLRVAPTGDALALLQYTSGSTGTPKGVMLTHGDLLANIRAIGQAARGGPEERFVSWLPLYHDMGLIGAWLSSLYFAAPLVLLSPLTFLSRPLRWLEVISAHGGTISGAPNFAYELCVSRFDPDAMVGVDLSSWRFAFNGAEPVSAETMRRFADTFAPWGLRPESLAPVYGMAEAAVGLAFPPPGRGVRVDYIDRQRLISESVATPVDEAGEAALAMVACGEALPGYSIRVVDPQGQVLPERHQGRVQFSGPSATQGYYRNPTATARLILGDGWLESGDLGYLVSGELYLTGRSKDLIIRGGRNIHPAEVEEAVGRLAGVRAGSVALFGVSGGSEAMTRLVLAAESRCRKSERQAQLREQIKRVVSVRIGAPPDEILLLRPGGILKTSSGKIRRAACRDHYLQGRLGRRADTLPRQLLRIVLASRGGLLRRGLSAAGEWLFAGWAWVLFLLLGIPLWAGVLLAPVAGWRWGVLRLGGRLLARLSGTRLTVSGLDSLPEGACLLVANHQSYLDGLVLITALPFRFRFVAKTELKGQVIAGRLLARIGSLFVERFDPQQGREDVEHLTREAGVHPPLLIFPEGTFVAAPGLLPFRLGAFAAATEAGVPVVPVVIRGSREMLPAECWFPRSGSLEVTLGEPMAPSAEGWKGALELRDRVRRRMLEMPGAG